MDKIRFTMDMETSLHKGLKAFTAMNGVSMKDYLISLIEKDLEKHHICPYGYEHKPNKKTIKAMEDDELIPCKDVNDIWD